ncbi:MAG: tetratricopeptide repeat protein [Candidatus Omnitrophica bacterium]|nr:tetratricopeptide repeat protein [Candidatus Omnitrophota bacterium]
MTKFKILAIVVLIFILGQSAGLLYFVSKTQGLLQKNQELVAKVERYGPGYEKLDKQFQEVSSKYTAAAKELETVKADRENILAQAKSLLGERAKAGELEEVAEKAKAEVSSVKKELEEAKNQGLSLKEEINKFQVTQAQLTKERDELKIAYEKAAKNTIVKELNNKISGLQKDLKSKIAQAQTEKKKLEAKLKLAEKENSRLTEEKNKWNTARDQLTGQLNDYKKNYVGAVKKNKALESKIKETPAKFTEIARQNKVLLRQTAEMHYNLGVFYTKNKEYDRAVAEFEKGIEINPNDASAHFNLGYIYSEYLVNRKRAMEHFRHFLRLTKSDDPDVDWVKKYVLTWETYEGKMPMQ